MSKMEKFQIALQSGAVKIQQNKIINPISNALMSAIPITIIGAIGSLLNSAPIPGYQAFLISSNLKSITQIPTEITTNLLALYIVFLVASKYAENNQLSGTIPGLLALMSFFIVTPFNYSEAGTMESYATNWMGAAGLFSSFIIGLSVAAIYTLFRVRGWVVKMPAGVPPTIAQSFAGLVPGFIVAFLALVIRYGLSLTSFGSIHQMIFSLIASPLSALGSSFPALVVSIIVAQVLWLVGVHGTLVILSVMLPIWTPLSAENLAAFNAGEPIPNLVTNNLLSAGFFAGSGMTLGLTFAMLFAKSEQFRALGRIAIVPNLVGINEPIIFGVPIVMNFGLAIPFVLTPVISIILGYLGMVSGVLPRLPGIGAPLGTPVVLSGLLSGASWRWGVFQALMLVMSYFTYLPFFRPLDRLAYENEQAAKLAE